MIRHHAPYVIGYHGCDQKVAMGLVSGAMDFKQSRKSFHWLGSGIYFWENDRARAYEWAVEKASRGELTDPFVIGAVIEFGRCLDLSVRENVPLIKQAHESLLALYERSGLGELPVNKAAPKDPRPDKVMRFLDCAVINHLAKLADQPFDTVRGLFVEGDSIYPGGEIYHKTHAEIAVRNPKCIVGLFIPR